MKKIGFILAFFVILAGCFEDEGNYDYRPVEMLTVTGMSNSYRLVAGVDTLEIDIEIKDGKDQVEYIWQIYNAELSNTKPDTLDWHSPHIKELLHYPTGKYTLLLEVKNPDTGLSVFQTAEIVLTTTYSDGWYLLKETNEGNTDLDFHFEYKIDTTKEWRIISDVLKENNKFSLSGKPVSIFYNPLANWIDSTNTRRKEQSFFIQSENEMKVYQIAEMVQTRTYSDCFYKQVLEYGKQINMFFTYYNMGLIDEGGLYTVENGNSVGKFGMARTNKKPYRISGNGISKNMLEFMVYDDLNGRYLHGHYTDNQLEEYSSKDEFGVEMPVHPYNLGMRLVFMGFEYNITTSGDTYAVLESVDKPTRRIVHVLDIAKITYKNKKGLLNPIKRMIEVEETSALAKADLICNNRDVEVLYCAVGDELYYCPVTGGDLGEEKLMKDFQGEEITYINHFKTTKGMKWGGLVVATCLNGQYKLYLFDLVGQMIKDKPSQMFKGQGRIKEAVYVCRDANIGTAPYK